MGRLVVMSFPQNIFRFFIPRYGNVKVKVKGESNRFDVHIEIKIQAHFRTIESIELKYAFLIPQPWFYVILECLYFEQKKNCKFTMGVTILMAFVCMVSITIRDMININSRFLVVFSLEKDSNWCIWDRQGLIFENALNLNGKSDNSFLPWVREIKWQDKSASLCVFYFIFLFRSRGNTLKNWVAAFWWSFTYLLDSIRIGKKNRIKVDCNTRKGT